MSTVSIDAADARYLLNQAKTWHQTCRENAVKGERSRWSDEAPLGHFIDSDTFIVVGCWASSAARARDVIGRLEAQLAEEKPSANARLIAAAPDLLQALRVAEVHLGWGDCTLENVHKRCQEAIAKATAPSGS